MPVPTRLHQRLCAAILTALLLSAGAASAQSVNFSTWVAAGDVLLGNSLSAATLSTAALDSGETPLSGQSALIYFDLEPALGVAVGTLGTDTYEGSGLAQTFTIAEPTTVRFNWVLASDAPFDAAYADRAFVIVDGTALHPLGALAAGPVVGSFPYTFSLPGSHSLAIVLVDVGDVTGVSTLSLSDLTVSAVPEPASLALLLAGLGGVAAGVARRRL